MSGPPIGHFIGKSHIARGVHYGGKVSNKYTQETTIRLLKKRLARISAADLAHRYGV